MNVLIRMRGRSENRYVCEAVVADGSFIFLNAARPADLNFGYSTALHPSQIIVSESAFDFIQVFDGEIYEDFRRGIYEEHP